MPPLTTLRPDPELQIAFAAGDAAVRAARAQVARELRAALLLLGGLPPEAIQDAMALVAAGKSPADAINPTDAWRDMVGALEAIYQLERRPLFSDGELDPSPISIGYARAFRQAIGSPGPLFDTRTFAGLAGLPARDLAMQTFLLKRGGEFVKQVTDATREGIRRALVDAMATRTKRQQLAAQTIRNVGGFGLDKRRQATLQKYSARLDPDLSKKRREDLVRRRHGRLIAERARFIADSELRTAGAAGQRDLWRVGADEKRIDAEKYRREWVTRSVRVCPRCAAMDGRVIAIHDDAFTGRPIEGAGKLNGTTESAAGPQLHPGCYCGERLVRAR